MRSPSSIVAIAAIALTAACSSDPAGPKTPISSMSAKIDGTAWNAVSIETENGPVSTLAIRGTSGSQTVVVNVPLGDGPGTQIIGGPTPMAGGLVVGSQAWLASRTQGGAGQITLTSVEPGHVVGSFEFTLAAQPGSSPTSRALTSG